MRRWTIPRGRTFVIGIGLTLLLTTLWTMTSARREALSGLDLPNPDFETGDLRGWHKTGDAFDFQPTLGDNPSARNREPSNHQGRWWIGGYERYQGKPGQRPGDVQGDEPTGTLTSEPFTIRGSYLTFLIGGGNHPWNPPTGEGSTCANLLVEGKVVRTATGNNSESMVRQQWRVDEFRGKRARIQLVDGHRGGWGHLNFDDVRLFSRWQAERGSFYLHLWTAIMLLLMGLGM